MYDLTLSHDSNTTTACGRLRARKFTSAAESRPGSFDQENELFHYLSVPRWCRVSHLDKEVRGPFARKDAVKDWPYIELNQKNRIWHLVLDLDCDHAVLDWYDSDIPFMPSYFVGRRKGGQLVRPHAVIKLSIPVNRSSWAQMRLLRVIQHRIMDLLADAGGPEGYQDRKMPDRSKNPRHRAWKVIVGDPRSWTLYELRDALGIPEKDDLDSDELRDKLVGNNPYFDKDDAARGRHCELFQRLRGPVYAYKKFALNEQDLFNFAMDKANEINDQYFAGDPLNFKSLRNTARSTSHWTWIFYTGSGKNDRIVNWGVCRREGLIDDSMNMSERQAVGGRYGATQHALKTFERVKEAYKQLKENGRLDAPLKAMVREFGIARNTIRKYRDFALAELEKSTGIPLSTFIEGLKNRGVKTVYQKSRAVRQTQAPDLRAERDGKVWEFWIDPNVPGILRDHLGRPTFREFVEPYIIWHADPPNLSAL